MPFVAKMIPLVIPKCPSCGFSHDDVKDISIDATEDLVAVVTTNGTF